MMKRNSSKKHDLPLGEAERKLILNQVSGLDQSVEALLRDTPLDQPIKMTLEGFDELAELIALKASETKSKKLEKNLDLILDKINNLIEDNDPACATLRIKETEKSKAIEQSAVQLATWVAQALAVAESIGAKNKPLPDFWLAPIHRDLLLSLRGISRSNKTKLGQEPYSFSVAQVASMTMALAEELVEAKSERQISLMLLATHLMDRLNVGIGIAGEAQMKPRGKRVPKSKTLYQFKITLRDSNPPIWRRIQVQDGTLDDLHKHIQTAMGWTNSHLHDFTIKGKRYGDPDLIDDGFEDFDCIDSTKTRISKILPKAGKRFTFRYQYDFGDGWEHEIIFEGCPPVDPKATYPLCLEGERACPPEDCGGIGGYFEFLEAINDKDHEQHKDMLSWIGGEFDPEKFEPIATTKAMRKGLPN